MDLNINAKQATISANNQRYVSVEIEGVDESDILEVFSLEEIISHYGDGNLLDIIGQKRVSEYFDLKPNENE